MRVGRPDDLRRADLVVQATPGAMAGGGPLAEMAAGEQAGQLAFTGQGEQGRDAEVSSVVAGVDPSWFGTGQLIVDLVYDPPLSPFLADAQRGGATVRNGLGMLVYQAARQIRLWTGEEPPLAAMWAAVAGDFTPAGPQGATGPWTWKSALQM